MLAIVVGYDSKDRSAAPRVLYCGRDAGAASDISLAPPKGIVRTELFKAPPATRTRHFAATAVVPDEIPAPPVQDELPDLKAARKAK